MENIVELYGDSPPSSESLQILHMGIRFTNGQKHRARQLDLVNAWGKMHP